MKLKIGTMDVSIDISGLLQGQGITIHINGGITPGLSLAIEFSYLPMAQEPVNLVMKVNKNNA